MNNEISNSWGPGPVAGDDAVGAALRRAAGARIDPVPDQLSRLLERLEKRRRRSGQAAMS
jgi:hypothetical protein